MTKKQDITQQQHHEAKPIRVRVYLGVLLAGLVVALLLGLDLRFRGLAWQFFWSQTGEEEAAGQLLGMVEVVGNLVRAQPITAPLTPIAHTEDIPYSINTFLQTETEQPKIREILRMIDEAGFTWLRQEFPWEDIEVDGRGQFTDTRNDYNGDGELDTIDAWEKYDFIVEETEARGLKMLVRLSNPPAWSRAENPETAGGAAAPPDDLQDFVNFAVAVAERYKGRITHYQVWNEPNIYPEWGEQFVNPAGYVEMLCRTYDALKQVDPQIIVVSAAIAPTIALDGFRGYQDLVYLQNMYDNGAGDCFDILAAQGYGLFSGPTDRRLRFNKTNFQRHVYYRDIMVRNGDAHKPIWISESGWTAVLDAFRPREEIADFSRFGEVTDDQLARWMPLSYERVQQEWPWVGQMSYWFFTRATIEESVKSDYYFRLVEADYSTERQTFTPMPVYHTLQAYFTQTLDDPVLYQGVHQAESWEVRASDDAQLQADEDAQLGEALTTQSLQFKAVGTRVSIRIEAPYVPVEVTVNGRTREILALDGGWEVHAIGASLLPRQFEITLAADAPFSMDSITVRDDSLLLVAGSITGGLLVVLLMSLFWWRRRHPA